MPTSCQSAVIHFIDDFSMNPSENHPEEFPFEPIEFNDTTSGSTESDNVDEQLDEMFQSAMDQADALEGWEYDASSLSMFTEPKVSSGVPDAGNETQTVLDHGSDAPEEEFSEENFATPVLSPPEILEAALFVGGPKLTTRKLRKLLNNDFSADYIESCVQRLNQQYETEGRPYEIRVGEHGYVMALRPEFEAVRRKVFGFGPREVKLSQDALEILSLVAYQQPISKQDVDRLSKRKASGILNQLLRRELITLERDSETREVTYSTAQRFLDLFGLADLEELPRAEDLRFK